MKERDFDNTDRAVIFKRIDVLGLMVPQLTFRRGTIHPTTSGRMNEVSSWRLA